LGVSIGDFQRSACSSGKTQAAASGLLQNVGRCLID
jgi:hypothetical protein